LMRQAFTVAGVGIRKGPQMFRHDLPVFLFDQLFDVWFYSRI
jgi:hypothetical protein